MGALRANNSTGRSRWALGRKSRGTLVTDGARLIAWRSLNTGEAFFPGLALIAFVTDRTNGAFVAHIALVAGRAFIPRLAIKVGHLDGCVAVGFAVLLTDIEHLILGIEIDAFQDARAAGRKVRQ